MSKKIHITLTLDTSDGAPLLVMQAARALSSYVSQLISEAIGGPVVSDQPKFEYGTVKMRVEIENKDYEAKEE